MISKKPVLITVLMLLSAFFIYNNVYSSSSISPSSHLKSTSSEIIAPHSHADENHSEHTAAAYSEVNSQHNDPIKAVVTPKKYICPMHSHILSDEAGNCPVCGMDLVINQSALTVASTATDLAASGHESNEMQNHKHSKMSQSEHESDQKLENKQSHKLSETYPEVRISPVVVHNLGIRSGKVIRGNLNHRIETIGKITRVDPMARSRVVSPLSGTILQMVNKYGGDRVKQDEFLFSVVSEELFSLQKAFQLAFNSGDMTTSSAMIPRLVAMGLDTEQVAKLQNGAEPNFPAKVYAKEDGYIFTKRGEPGEAITSSFTVFNLGGDYQVIEVTVEIFERQWDLVKEGQMATMQLRNLPGKIFHGMVERVDEPVGYTTRALESRLKFKTTHKGMTQSTFARVLIDGKTKENVLIVPRDAVIRTAGGDRIVKIKMDGSYQPVKVIIGEESDGKIEILSGVNEGDLIVTSGQFLIDSESNLMAGLNQFSDPSMNDGIQENETKVLKQEHRH